MCQCHHKNTGRKARVCVGDSKYGTIENYLFCFDYGVKGHFESFEKLRRGSGRQKGIFAKKQFIYDTQHDQFTCPAGQILKKRRYSTVKKQFEYCASTKVCRACNLRKQCTRSSLSRSLKRHLRQDDLDIMLAHKNSPGAKTDIHIRQHLMERSFARGIRYGLKRARWRRLWRVQIQEYLTASIQNMVVLLKNTQQPKAALGCRVERSRVCSLLINLNATVFTIFNALAYRSRRSVYSF